MDEFNLRADDSILLRMGCANIEALSTPHRLAAGRDMQLMK